MAWVVVALPPAASWTGQAAYEQVFGQVPRHRFRQHHRLLGRRVRHSYVLAKMKLWTRGKHLWSRTIGSTLVGQGVDSLIFYRSLFTALGKQYPAYRATHPMGAEGRLGVLLTPVTYAVVGWLKRREGVDVYDEGTDFTPFRASL